MKRTISRIIGIGGSAGSLTVVNRIVAALPEQFDFAIVIVLHRMRNVSSDLHQLLSDTLRGRTISEPDDKQPILPGGVYLAPQNYHLLVDRDSFSLDYSEAVLFSRPSIDVSFESMAQSFKERVTGVLLSGANQDGAAGLRSILDAGGNAIIQDPSSAGYPTMPKAGLRLCPEATTAAPQEIIDYIHSLVKGVS